mgnify:CR=1 FL=1
MRDTGVTAALAAALEADPDAMERDELSVLMRHLAMLRGFVDAADVRVARRLRALAAEGRSESATAALMDDGRRSGKEANATRDREQLCDELPAFEDALATGDVSADHLDVLAKLTKGLDDTTRSDLFARADELLDVATGGYVSEFDKHCRTVIEQLRGERAEVDAQAKLERQRRDSMVRRWVDEATGMHKTLIELDPVRDAAWWSAIDAQLAALRQQDGSSERTFQELEIEAVLAAASAGEAAQRLPELLVIVDDRTLVDGLHDHSVRELSDGTQLPTDTVRRMGCDATLVPLLTHGGDFERLRLGREQRTASRPQRRALRALYRSCAHPECPVGFERCRIHHITFWRNGGDTDMSNLVPLCERHHHLVHEGGWQIELDPLDRTLTWTRPDGTTWRTTRPDRMPAPALAG